MEKEKTTTIIVIIICLIAIAIFGFWKPFTIVGTMEFPYSFSPNNRKALFIGSDYFLPRELQFNCASQYDGNAWTHRTPNNCWSTDIIWSEDGDIQHFTMIAGETKQLNDYLEVKFNPEGHTNYDSLTNYHDLRHWNNKFTFKIINKDFLSSRNVDDDYEILLNSDKNMKIEITNKLAPNIRGGLWIKTTNILLFREKTTNSYFYLQKGTAIYENAPVSTDFLGIIRVERNPFVIINNNVEDIKLMDNTPTYTEYKVVRTIPSVTCDNTAEVCCEDRVLRRECDRIRLGLNKGTACGGDIDTGTGNYPNDVIVEGKWKNIKDYTWAIVLIIIVVIGAIIWEKKK